jgi:DNA invertase Pin-like site-specific DNA recombinase
MVAEIELSFINYRQRAGIEAAKAKGVDKGRPVTFDRAKFVALRKEGLGATEIARAVGYKWGNVQGLESGRGCVYPRFTASESPADLFGTALDLG